MILDDRLEFADATALSTAGTGRALVGDVIDLGGVSQDIGAGEDLYVVIQMDAAATSGGAATVAFEVATDAQAAIATDGTASVHLSVAAAAVGTYTAGKLVLAAKLPPGAYERYLGILQNVGAFALTAGRINAFLTKDISRWQAYPDAVN